ncbi:hypothetical protein RQP46_010513 [Phenoliferia psychrophenolica]
MLPSFPYEITEKILKLGTLQLVYEERRHSKLVGQANAFLLSAALVSHTWRNIAQPLLTKHGLVDPFRALPFISELERQGVLSTLHAVRVGRRAGHDDSGWGPRSGPAYNLLGLIPMIAKITRDPLDLADVAPLVELATHLPIFEDSADRFPPNLTTLKILRDVGKHHSELYISPEDTILSLLTTLSALKELEIPDCWRSDAVEEACEAKGVALTWSSTCE